MLADPSLASLESRVRLLRSIPELAIVSEATLVALAADSRFRRFEEGAAIWRDGEPIISVFLVLEGRVDIQRKGRHAFTAERHAAIGIVPILAEDTEGLDARALATTLVLEIPKEAVLSSLERDFGFLRSMLGGLSRQLLSRRALLPVHEDAPALGTWRSEELTVVERIVQLRKTPLGRSNLDALAELARSVSEVRFGVGHAIWEAGDPATHWLRIDYGHVRCTSPSGGTALVGAGYTFGLLDSLARSARAYSTRAETEVIALKIELIDWFTLLELHVPLSRQIMQFLARGLLAP